MYLNVLQDIWRIDLHVAILIFQISDYLSNSFPSHMSQQFSLARLQYIKFAYHHN